jgi:hypothetical protein
VYLGPLEFGNKLWQDTTKSASHQVIDILARLPSIMEDVDDMRECSDIQNLIRKAAALAEKSRALWNDFHSWHQSQDILDDTLRYWLESSIIHPKKEKWRADESKFHFVQYLNFSSLETAHSELLYWTGLLLLYSTHFTTCCWLREVLGSIFELLSGGADAFSYPENSTLGSAAQTCAINIAQSLEYFVKPEMGGLGIGLVGFPMSVAMGYFQYSNAPEKAWFEIILRYIRREYAVPLDGLLESMFKREILKLVRV